jgi:hypothetical protein
MSKSKKLDQIIVQMESYLECWKQFSGFVNLARSKKFTQDDEMQFLEVKSLITQELEMILAAFEQAPINRDDIHQLISSAASIRNMSEMNENALRAIETQWHKIFIGLQSILGQLKVKRNDDEGGSFWGSLFGGKKK